MQMYNLKRNLMTNRVDKPWGFYEDYFRNKDVVFKKIVVLPNEKLSYQFHLKRGEFWYIYNGEGILTHSDIAGRYERHVKSGNYVIIDIEEKHMIECNSDEPLVIYEMQFGECSEDDIIRLEDKYGRIEE